MKHSIARLSLLLGLGLPLAAQAACDSYPNSEHGLSLPATITVPDSLPVGSEIIRRPFSGVVPARFINCTSTTWITIVGRYPFSIDPQTNSIRTEVPGVGMKLLITDSRPRTNAFSTVSGTTVIPRGKHPIFTNAEAVFYKIGPVTSGVVPAGNIFDYQMLGTGSAVLGRFHLLLNTSVRFVRPSATCDLAAGDANRTISLDPIQVSDLNTAKVAGTRDFDLTANCSDASEVTFRFSGTPAPGDTSLFANTGTARGVDLRLHSRINGATQTIAANGTQNERKLVVTGNRAVLPLSAAYHKNGTVSQGTLASTATVNITYN